MPDPTMTEPDAPPLTLTTARTTAEIAKALALYEWYEAHGDGECPPDAIPSEVDLATWLPSCPATVRHEVLARFEAVVTASPKSWPEGIQLPPRQMKSEPPTPAGGWKVPPPTLDLLQALASRLEASGPQAETLAQVIGAWINQQSPAVEVVLLAPFFRAWISDPAALDNSEYLLLGYETIHAVWLAIPTVDRPLHPFAPLMRAWQERPVLVETDRRKTGIIPMPFAGRVHVQDRQGILPLDFNERHNILPAGLVATPSDQASLPGFEGIDGITPAFPLLAFDRAGGRSMTRGRGAPPGLRAFLELLMSVPRDLRMGGRILRIKRRELFAWLWPQTQYQQTRHWKPLLAALSEVNNMGIPWPGGYWLPVRVWNVPHAADPDGAFVFEVRLPEGSERGPLVDRPRLRLTGVKSAPTYRAMLNLAYLWDKYGTHQGGRILPTRPAVLRDTATGALVDPNGKIITGRGDIPVKAWNDPRAIQTGKYEPNPARNRYPALTGDDLVRLCFPEGEQHRMHRTRARAVLVGLAREGDCCIERDGKGWRTMPPDTHWIEVATVHGLQVADLLQIGS